MDKKQFGKWAEQLAVEYLITQGYIIVVRNWHCRFGELDIVAKKDGMIHFIEVKARRSWKFGFGEESMPGNKLQRLELAIGKYLENQEIEVWQLDLIVVENYSGQVKLTMFEAIG